MRAVNRRGVVVPVLVAAIVIFLGLLALVVDGGLLYLGAGELRTFADAAALVAVTAESSVEAEELVAAFLDENGRQAIVQQVSWQKADEGAQEVTVVLRHTIGLFMTRGDDGNPAKRSVSVSSRARAGNGQIYLVPCR